MNRRASQLQTVIELILLAALCYFFYFYGLAAFGLTGADEPRYAQVAREMAQRHDWITPTLYGNVWLEKPILYYWGAIVSYKLFGVSDWAARLPGAVFATVMTAFVYFWSRRFRIGAQLDAIVITVSTVLVFAFARAASIDIHLVAPVTIAMLAWWGFYETRERRWLVVFYAALAIGVLAKGPVAVALAGMIVVVFVALRREWDVLLQSLWWPGIVLFFAIALPWYVAVQRANPGFFREFFITHNLSRFTTNRFQHRQHFWYYIPVFLGGTLPWTALVIAGLVRAAKNLREREDPLLSFLAIWILVPLVFFSFSQSKLPGYILPSIAPCGLLVAVWLREQSERVSPLLVAVHALLCGTLLSVAVLAPYKLYRLPFPGSVLRLAIPLGLMTALIVAIAVFLRGYSVLRIATVLPIAMALGFLLRAAGPAIDSTQSMRPLAQRIASSPAAHDPVLFFEVPRGVEYGLAFYLDRQLPEPPPDEIVKFGTAAAGDHAPEKTLKDVSRGPLPDHGGYLVVMRAGAVDRFAGKVSPDLRVEPFFRFSAQRLDLYYVREAGPNR